MSQISLKNKFSISKYGFLPEKCHNQLPSNFKFMKEVIDNLAETDCQNIRPLINKLELYDPEVHSVEGLSLPERQYLYSILCMVAQRYVWCSGVADAKNYASLPAIIGMPLYEVSNSLGIPPVLTHAAVDLYNWHLKDESKPFDLDNIDTNHTMTGNSSEAWFYKVMIAIEGIGGEILDELLTAHKNFEDKNFNYLLLSRIEVLLIKCTKIIKRMYEHCDAKFFFNNLRIYLSGSKNDNLPDGLTIEGYPDINFKYIGGSAAQSTLIQVFDVFLDVLHQDDRKTFLETMQFYMPGAHRDYLEALSSKPSIVYYLDDASRCKYNNCLEQLSKFRDSHLGLVRHYIMQFVPSQSQEKQDDNVEQNTKNAHGAKGSGGTSPVEFCKGVIDETRASKRKITQTETNNNTMYVSSGMLIFAVFMWWLWQC
jgi:indoleamine 2,3-dioxygenase